MAIRSTSVLSKSYVFDPRPRLLFRIAAKQYWIREHVDAIDSVTFSKAREDALTLIFIHGNGSCKECWEPTIQRLFENQNAQRAVRFHDMWSLDIPNQGDSAVLNEEVFRWRYKTFSWDNHARCVHALLAGLGVGVDVDFSKRKLVIVGHSMGGGVAILVTAHLPELNISSLHLMEPYVLGEMGQDLNLRLIRPAEKRRDIWPSSEEAFQALKVRPTLRAWDERNIRIFAEHGLRPLPTAEYPDLKEGVTRKCTRKQGVATCRDSASMIDAYKYLPYVLKKIPTHITYGTLGDFIPQDLQEEVLQVGIPDFASVTKVPGAEHLIVQTLPDVVADIIWKSSTQSPVRALNDNIVAKL